MLFPDAEGGTSDPLGMLIVEDALRAAGLRIVRREPVVGGAWGWTCRSATRVTPTGRHVTGYNDTSRLTFTERMLDEVNEQNASKFRAYVDTLARAVEFPELRCDGVVD